MPPKHPTTSIQPGSQTCHFPCNTNNLQCQTFTAHRGLPPAPLSVGPGAPFQLFLRHPVLAPATIREQQAWDCTGRKERVATAWAGQCPPQAGCSPTASLIFKGWLYISLPTVSFTPSSPAQSAMSHFDLVDNYFSVCRVLHHAIFFSPFTIFKRFWSLPLLMQRCKFIVSFLFSATHFARVSACALTHAELSVRLYTLPASVKIQNLFPSFLRSCTHVICL